MEMGSGTKFSKVFFTNFNDNSPSLTMNGVLDPKDHQGGYIFFVSFTWGTWNPRVLKEKIKIRILAKLTTGEVCKDSVWIRVNNDNDFIEKFVPGIINQIGHHTAWDLPVD